MQPLHRLVYTSFRSDECSEQDIKDILASCKKNNPGKNLTGLLMHTDKKFIQVLEGEKETIQKLYDVVKEDKRHWGVNLRSLKPIDERAFPDWHMAFKDVSLKDMDYHTDISDKDKSTYESILSGNINYDDGEGVRILKLFMKTA